MRFLTAITSSVILLSPVSASAFDSEGEFRSCIKSNFMNYYSELRDVCGQYMPCEPEQDLDLENLQRVYRSTDNIFSTVQLGSNPSAIIQWGQEIGLNEENTKVMVLMSIDKCGISF